MKNRHPKLGGIVLVLVVVSLACAQTTNVTPTPTLDLGATTTVQALAIQQTQVALDATSVALAESMTKAAASPTPAPTSTLTPTITATPGPLVIEDDFSKDVGRWIECEKCLIADGVMYMGPYPSLDSAEGYTVICRDCGIVDDYKMGVDVTYAAGASDRGFGLLLWENDGYYMDFEISTWQNYGMWFYDKSKGKSWDAWYYIMDKPYMRTGSIRPGRLTNHLEVVVSNASGRKMATVSINGQEMKTVELKGGPGRVGLVVGFHSLGVTFDNFSFEGKPVKLPQAPGNNG